MKAFLIVATILVVGLVVTNPGMDDFSEYASEYTERIVESEVGDNALGRAMARFGSSLAGDYVDRITTRKNYLLFSTYELGNSENEDENWRFVGIASNIFNTHQPPSD